MADPTRKKSKDRGASSVAQSNVVPFTGPVPLRFWITPANGTPPFEVDLTEFADGPSSKHRERFLGFRGRPKLIRDLAPSIMARHGAASANTWREVTYCLREFWRFLERLPEGISPSGLTDLDEVIGALWHKENIPRAIYTKFKGIVEAAREMVGLYPQIWPSRRHADTRKANDVCPIGMRRLYNALKVEASAIVRLWQEGDELAARGKDPGEPVGGDVALKDQAWILRNRGLPFLRKSHLSSLCPGEFEGRPVPGGANLHASGFMGKLRWFYPGIEDIIVFYLLFAIQSGWNLETNLNLDVTTDDSWSGNHPHRPELAVLRSIKRKVGRQQIALSLRRPQFHMFRLIQIVTERTAPLREDVRRQIGELDSLLAASPGDMALRAKRAKLEMAARSPWTFLGRNNTRAVASLTDRAATEITNTILRAIISRHDVRDANGRLVSITASDLRDAWIGYAYANSGYSWLVAKLAAGHTNAATLRTYLRQRQWRIHGEERYTALQTALWAEIRNRRIVDGAVLRRMVEGGEITDEQRRRWEGHKSRTRMGLGCRNPTKPPSEIAPDHVEDEICRVQRCSLCVHGLVFADSLDGLARRKAELTHIQETMPLGAWIQSTFSEEAEALEATLKLFETAKVDAACSAWLAKIRSGVAYVFDQEGAYDDRVA